MVVNERAIGHGPRLLPCRGGWRGRARAFVAIALAAPCAFGAPPGPDGAPGPASPEGPRPAGRGRVEGARAGVGDAAGGAAARFEPRAPGLWARGAVASEAPWRKPVGFAGLGVGAALLGAGVYSTLRLTGAEGQWSEPSLLAYRTTVRTPHDPCEAARRGVISAQAGAASPEQVRGVCAQASTFEALQYAFYGAGAIFGGLGALFLLSTGPSREAPAPRLAARRSGPPKPSWRLQPSFGRTAASLTLHVRFF